MTPLRRTVLQIIPTLETGGAELAAVEISAAITSAGGRALVVSEGGRMEPALAAAGGELVRMPVASKSPLTLRANTAALVKLARQEGVALIHARSRAPAWSGLWAARRLGIPFVTTYHGAYSEKGPVKRLYNSVMARGDIVIANSHYTADLIRARYATPEGRLRVVHRGVDLAQFDRDAVDEPRVSALRAAWGVNPGQRVILNAGRLTGWKGQQVVIAAAQLMAERLAVGNVDWVVILAGDAQGRDDYRTNLERQIADSGLSNRVRLVGHCADMPAAFKLADLAVVASTEPEAFGRAAAEAQALGCATISTNIGAPPETVLAPPRVSPNEATGRLVPPNDAGALADAMEELLTLETDVAAELSARAIAHVQQQFSLDQMKRGTLDIYRALLEHA